MHYIKKQLSLIFLFTISIVSISFGQTQKADEYYFNPVFGNNNITIIPDQCNKGFIDKKLTKTIDKVNKKGGGIITIKNGDYKFKKGVVLKSNVHIHIESDVNFYMDQAGVMFSARSTTSGKPISNFSLIGLSADNTEPFTVNFKYGNSKTNIKKNGFVKLGYSSNFKISNVKIIDAYTGMSSIVLSSDVSSIDILFNPDSKKNKKNGRTSLINEVFGVPSKGIIEKIYNENASYGYGLVQMQAGNNIVYRDLSGTGGVTLRLESGLNINQLFRPVDSAHIYLVKGIELPVTIDKQPKIDQVYANNISCENGHAAFTMSPHTGKARECFSI